MTHSELTKRQQAMLSAALRHVRDADHLLESEQSQSLDQAFHLAGYGPECIRKALLADAVFDKILGHRLGGDMEETLATILMLELSAHRYEPRRWGSRWPALGTWKEQARYEPTGRRAQAEVRPLVKQAVEAVGTTLAALWADGRIPAGFPW